MFGEHAGLVSLAGEYLNSNNGPSPEYGKISAQATQNILMELNTHIKNFKIPFNLGILAQKLEDQMRLDGKNGEVSRIFSGQNQRYSLKVTRSPNEKIDFGVSIYDLSSKSWPAEPVFWEGTYLVIADKELRERVALKLNADSTSTSLEELREAFRKTSRFRLLSDPNFREFYTARLI